MEIDNSFIRTDEANEEKLGSVRPKSFKEFIGQSDTKNNLIIFAKSAKKRDTAIKNAMAKSKKKKSFPKFGTKKSSYA